VCGRSACTVRREGGLKTSPPYPYVRPFVHRFSKVRVLVSMLWHTVTESNCVAERRGGEQLEVNDQSVTQVNSIRLNRCGEPAR
jgi:hypothetical protein